ncbi:MAG TPA: YitT family protein [Bacteroidales bacterium]|nr:YitT family protein [Bacteroidales bacterium]
MANKFKLDTFKEYVTILFGLALYALGWTGFLLPHQITTGGITGLGALIFFANGLPVAVTYFSINIVLLIISVRMFGWKFSLRTIVGVLILTLFLSVAQNYIHKPLLVGEPFMACVIGGILAGAGVGTVLTANGSTGGTDIIALIINKYRNITPGRAMLYSDLLIICSSYFLFHSVDKIIYGLTTLAVSTYAVDMVVNGDRQSVQFFIFSSKFESIAERINNEAHRGVTVLDGMGWYSKEPAKVLCVMARKNESVKIFRIVKQVDPNAFVSQGSVIGVYGKGFDIMKSK